MRIRSGTLIPIADQGLNGTLILPNNTRIAGEIAINKPSFNLWTKF